MLHVPERPHAHNATDQSKTKNTQVVLYLYDHTQSTAKVAAKTFSKLRQLGEATFLQPRPFIATPVNTWPLICAGVVYLACSPLRRAHISNALEQLQAQSHIQAQATP